MGLISGLVVLGLLRDRFAFRGETLHVTADKFLQVRFTSHEEIIADACELVVATLCDQQRELLYALAADELCLCHAAAFSCSALNLS